MLVMKKYKNLEFEPLHPKNVLLASEVHGISCLFLVNLMFENNFYWKFRNFLKKVFKVQNCLKKSKIEKLDIGKLYARKLKICL
jgi:hypothetical protein